MSALNGLGMRVERRATTAHVVAFLCLALIRAHAQDMRGAAPEPSPIPVGYEAAVEKEALPPSEGPNPSVEISAGDSGISATANRFHYALHLTIRGVYDDNINISHTNRIDDYFIAIEPGITIGFGDIFGREGNYIRLDYSPSIFLFVDHDGNDAVEHLVHIEAFHRFSRLALTLGQDIAILDGASVNLTAGGNNTGQMANIDVGGRTRVNILGTKLGWTYDLTGKTFLSGEFLNTLYDYPNSLISSDCLSGSLYINYNYSPKLAVGVGGGAGYNWVDSPTPNQIFEQANVRMTYQATGKVTLNASAGVEFRQFENNGAGDHVSPVYELGASYRPFDGTTLTVSGSRRTLNSAVFGGQDYAASNIVLGVQQRLLQRIYLGLTGGYENAEYFSALNGVSANRSDDYYFIEPAIDVTIMRFWSAGAYYLHRENSSNFTSFSFDDNQVGVRTTLTF